MEFGHMFFFPIIVPNVSSVSFFVVSSSFPVAFHNPPIWGCIVDSIPISRDCVTIRVCTTLDLRIVGDSGGYRFRVRVRE